LTTFFMERWRGVFAWRSRSTMSTSAADEVLPAARAKNSLRSSTSYASITTSIGTPNSTGQRCAYRAPATKSKRAVSDHALSARFFVLTRI
jgi:hypothetical protein